MRRKNKRHDSKGSPEKSPEKPSRRSNRHSRRRKKSSSSSPEKEVVPAVKVDPSTAKGSLKDKKEEPPTPARSYTPELPSAAAEVIGNKGSQSQVEEASCSKRHKLEEEKDVVVVVQSAENADKEWKEDKGFWESGNEKVAIEGTIENKEKEGTGVWKVQSANGAGGEIQKLKICRQRLANTHEESSPKRKSTRLQKDSNQRGPDDSSETDDQAHPEADSKSLKHKSRTRSSSRNSPSLQDSPKVVCDVSEDNPTRIKIHLGNKSPEKLPISSPVIPDKEKVGEDSAVIVEDQTAGKETTTEEMVRERVNEGQEVSIENEATKVSQSPENGESQAESENKKVNDEIVTENCDELMPMTFDAESIQNIELPADEPKEIVKRFNSHSPSPRDDKSGHMSSSSQSTDESEDSGSNSNNSNRNETKRKKRRRDGIQSTVTRQTSTPLIEENSHQEEESGKQEPEEEEEEEEVPEVSREEEEEEDGSAAAAKTPPNALDKENVVAASQSSSGTTEPVTKKRRWGASKSIRPAKKPVLCISTDSLKNLIPDAKLVSVEEVRLSVEEDTEKEQEAEKGEESEDQKEAVDVEGVDEKKKDKKESRKEKEKRREKEREKEEKKLREKREMKLERPTADGQKVSRRICVLSEDARKLARSPSPPRHRPSNVLFITNLVRPFTVVQLRNLLARTGKIVENGFWIDKIKSKCYVQYTDDDAAIETRHALHGVRWPVSNPRTLCVEFASYDDMAVAQALSEETEPIPRKAEPLQVDRSVEGWLADQARLNMDRPPQRRVVREWDVGKPAHPDEEIEMRSSRPDYEDMRDRDRRAKKERSHRSRSPESHEPPPRKPRRKEDAPAKLLDDLFRKTKTSPCIYWLPLTAEQIVVKEEMRRQHMAEHERRVAEMKKAEQARRERERRPRK